MVAEVVHGAPCRFSDPARFSLAHGGKDGHPFPVPLRVYDETVRVLRTAVENAKLGLDDKLHALERLDRQARTVDTQDRAGEGERASRPPSAPPPAARPPHRPTFEQFVQDERAQSDHLGGRTVFDDRRKPRVARAATKRAGPKPGVGQQLKLPGVKSRG
jgi:hypothetical protein